MKRVNASILRLALYVFYLFDVQVSTQSQLWDSVSTSNCSSTHL